VGSFLGNRGNSGSGNRDGNSFSRRSSGSPSSNVPQVLGNAVRNGDTPQSTFRREGSSQQANGSTNVDRSRLNSFLNGRPGNGVNKGTSNSSGTGSSQASTGSNKSGQGTRHYAGRLSDDQVRNFLNMRGNSRLADNDRSNKGDGNRNGNGISGKTGGQVGSRDKDGFKNGDNLGRGNGPRFGDGDNNSNKNGKDVLGNVGNGRGDFFKNRDNNRDHDGKFDRNNRGSFNGQGKGNFVRNGKNNDFRGRDSDRQSFNKWQNTWKGRHGDGHDHRDWSGKWRDGDRFNVANNIRSNWWNRHDHHNFPFRGGWWGGYGNWGRYNNWGWGGSRFWDDYCVRYNRPWYWWGWTTAPILTDWCSFGWNTPYYWDYGPNEYIYCNNGVVYVNGAWYEPAPVFYAQTVQMIDQAPVPAPAAAAQVEWLPLGVFAVTPDGMNEPDVMAQLAVTKEGAIGGTVMDQKANKSYDVTGTVDKNSQRAVWSYTNDKNVRVVMETSVNNLTQNESTGMVHYGPDDQRVIELVRLEDPSTTNEQLPAPPQAGAQQNVAKPPVLAPPTPPQNP
jgi:hypothetical protein